MSGLPKQVKHKPIELITWNDPSGSVGWEDKPSHRLVKCHSVGWVVREDDEKLTIVASVSGNKGVGDRNTIPKGCILERQVLGG